MKKIDLNIEIPQKDIFDEMKFKKDNPELYEKYVLPPTEESCLKIVINWISNMIERAINSPDPKTGRATKTASMDVHRKYNKVMDCIEKNEDGIVKIEDDDFKFLNRKFHQAEIPVQRDINQILIPISDAIKRAEIEEKPKGKKDDKVKKEMIE